MNTEKRPRLSQICDEGTSKMAKKLKDLRARREDARSRKYGGFQTELDGSHELIADYDREIEMRVSRRNQWIAILSCAAAAASAATALVAVLSR